MKTADLIIFSGQSNMQGQTEVLKDPRTVPGAYEYKYLSDSLVPLSDPFGEDITYDGKEGECYRDELGAAWHPRHVFGSSAYGHSTLVPSFCRTYVRLTGREVVAVSAAKGSTVLADWLPGTPAYEFLCLKAQKAKELAGRSYDAGRVYTVFLQGESDAIYSTDEKAYSDGLISLARALRRDIGLDRFGLIRVGRFTNDPRDDVIINAQENVCREDPAFLMLSRLASEMCSVPEYMNPFVGGHFSALGLEVLGGDAAKTLALARP